MIEVIDESKCRGCRICVDYCPMDVLRLDTSCDELAPCQSKCPAGTDIRGYLYQLNQGNPEETIRVISDDLPFPAITGRVCPHPCESKCARQEVDEAVNICSIERFIGDAGLKQKVKPYPRLHTSRVAIAGSGPAGLSAAYGLVKKGYPVTVFEAELLPGGMLRYGIPAYRLPRKVLDNQIKFLEKLGIEFQVGVTIGKDVSLNELKNRGFKAILVATGAQNSLKLGIPGEGSKDTYSGLAFLKALNSGEKIDIGKRVIVVGGGNVAVDSARTAIRAGAGEVKIFYRRSRDEMPAYAEGVAAAEDEGIKVEYFASPTRITSDGTKLTGVEFIKVQSNSSKSNGKSEPKPIGGSEFIVNVDTVILAIGETQDTSLLSSQDTSGVFAGGDVITGPSSVIEAIASGKKAALAIERYLTGVEARVEGVDSKTIVTNPPKERMEKIARLESPALSVEQRLKNFLEVKTGFSEDMTLKEAARCMTCGSKAYIAYLSSCMTCYNCELNCPDKAVNVNPLRKIEPVLIQHPGDKTNFHTLYTLKNKGVPERKK